MFVSFYGKALDEKAPLLRSMEAVSKVRRNTSRTRLGAVSSPHPHPHPTRTLALTLTQPFEPSPYPTPFSPSRPPP